MHMYKDIHFVKYYVNIFDKMHMYKDIVYTLHPTMMDGKGLTMLRITKELLLTYTVETGKWNPRLIKWYMLSCFSHVWLCATPWTAGLSMWFSRQEYWSGLPFPSPKWYAGPPNLSSNSYVNTHGNATFKATSKTQVMISWLIINIWFNRFYIHLTYFIS